MFRIKALNDAASSSDKDDGLPPKEACQEILEEAALKRYKEGLLMQKKELWLEACDVYKEVLAYPVIVKAEPVEDSMKLTDKGLSPLFGKTSLSIAYACYKNLGEIHRKLKQYETALDYYSEAVRLDGTDVTVWYRAGIIASKLGLISLASQTFLQGTKCSSEHWPCLDRACLSLYVEGDYPKCLEQIGNCFERNEDFSRGFILRDLILEEQPSLEKDIKILYPNINLNFQKKYSGPDGVKAKLQEEVKALRANRDALKKNSKTDPIRSVNLVHPLEKLSWLTFGQSLMDLRLWMLSQEEPISLLTPVNLLDSLSEVVTAVQNQNLKDEVEPMEVASVDEKANDKIEDEIRDNEWCEERRGKRKLGSALMEELLWSGKRRSARVRSSRKEHESYSVADALRTILPRKLLHQMKALTRTASKGLDENSMDTMELYKLFEKQGGLEDQKDSLENRRYNVETDREGIIADEGYFNTLQEEKDLRDFIENSHNKALHVILQSFVCSLQNMWTKTWPKPLLSIFMDCYKLVRPVDPLSRLQDKSKLLTEYGASLLFLEFALDSENIRLDEHEIALTLHGLKKFSGNASNFPDPEAFATFLIRFLWLSAHINLKQGHSSSGIIYLNTAVENYENLSVLAGKTLRLRNCRRNNEITKDILQGTLAALSRKRSLAEVIRLYESESYEEVTKILIESFNSEATKLIRNEENELIDRQTQLAMLINALHCLGDFKECVYWLEVSCYDLLGKVNSCDKIDDQVENQEWKFELDKLLVAVMDCCKQGNFKITDALPLPRLSRLVQTLCCVICRQIEEKERPPCVSRPWIMLNTILLAMEEQEEQNAVESNVEESLKEVDLPASVMALFTAHEYLGRREWCNCDGYVLLFLIMDQVIPKIRLSKWTPFRETVQQHLEQVVFCLYAHPNKKTKARYLTDHNVSSIELTWERAMQIFELFRPDETPCFDSLRTNIIPADSEALFRRIAAIIPDEINPGIITESMTDFIYGRTTTVPTPKVKLPAPVINLFYILGDYYYRTHETVKAVNYLLIDLCANPARVDSWASIAFSKVYILELQLNSCSPINNADFLEEAMAVTRCFEHSLQLDGSLCTIWIEYGNFSYWVFSFCSQRLKIESESLSINQFEEIEETKTKMLDTAKNAFYNANLIWNSVDDPDKQDERWLHYYMLGKIHEKHGDMIYLEYYNKASQLLYEKNAHYPKKISYNTPQLFSIEALEIYYRVHVCVIKLLELQDGEPLDEKTGEVVAESLKRVSEGPFATMTSKSDLQRKLAKAEEEKESEKKRIKEMMIGIIEEILDKIGNKSEGKIPAVNEAPTIELKDNIHKRPGREEETEIEPTKKKIKYEASAPNTGSTSKNEAIDPNGKECELENDGLEKFKAPLNDVDVEPTGVKTSAVLSEDVEMGDNGNDTVLLNSSSEVGNSFDDPMESYEATKFAPSAMIPPNQPIAYDYATQQYFEPYPHEQLLDDNYFLTLDDFKQEMPVKCKPAKVKPVRFGPFKKRPRQKSVSSVSSVSSVEDVKYDDESSSSSGSSIEEKKSRATSSARSESSDDEPDKVETSKQTSGEPASNKKDPSPIEEKITDENPKSNIAGAPEEKPPSPPELNPEAKMLNQCLRAFETCAIRFPQHYKSIYRLANFFFRSKRHRDLNKCRDLLLGHYPTSEGTITGLFAERKNTNFFNGIWRLPAGDVDRPGSFASHMSRSVLLLLEVLRDLHDFKLLFEMSVQLRTVPEPDKTYLREDERKQFSKQALDLSVQSVRYLARHSRVMTVPVVLDAYRVYRKAQKHIPSKEAVFSESLLDCYERLGEGKKCSLDQCLRFCKGEITGKTKSTLAPSATSDLAEKPKVKKLKKEGAGEDITNESKGNLPPKVPNITKDSGKHTTASESVAASTVTPTALPVESLIGNISRSPLDKVLTDSAVSTSISPTTASSMASSTPVIKTSDVPEPTTAVVSSTPVIATPTAPEIYSSIVSFTPPITTSEAPKLTTSSISSPPGTTATGVSKPSTSLVSSTPATTAPEAPKPTTSVSPPPAIGVPKPSTSLVSSPPVITAKPVTSLVTSNPAITSSDAPKPTTSLVSSTPVVTATKRPKPSTSIVSSAPVVSSSEAPKPIVSLVAGSSSSASTKKPASSSKQSEKTDMTAKVATRKGDEQIRSTNRTDGKYTPSQLEMMSQLNALNTMPFSSLLPNLPGTPLEYNRDTLLGQLAYLKLYEQFQKNLSEAAKIIPRQTSMSQPVPSSSLTTSTVTKSSQKHQKIASNASEARQVSIPGHKKQHDPPKTLPSIQNVQQHLQKPGSSSSASVPKAPQDYQKPKVSDQKTQQHSSKLPPSASTSSSALKLAQDLSIQRSQQDLVGKKAPPSMPASLSVLKMPQEPPKQLPSALKVHKVQPAAALTSSSAPKMAKDLLKCQPSMQKPQQQFQKPVPHPTIASSSARLIPNDSQKPVPVQKIQQHCSNPPPPPASTPSSAARILKDSHPSQPKAHKPSPKSVSAKPQISHEPPKPLPPVQRSQQLPINLPKSSSLTIQRCPQPAHKQMPPPSISSQKDPPPAHKPQISLSIISKPKPVSQAPLQSPLAPNPPPRPAIQQSPPNSSKFSIDDILGKNPGLSIVPSSARAQKPESSSEQAEAINLSPQRKPQAVVSSKSSQLTKAPAPKKTWDDPDIITIDD